jgi:hypothetical protein
MGTGDLLFHAANLEIGLTEHCDLSCRSCSHVSPVLHRRELDVDRLARDLAILSRHYHARRVRLLGGEPLLHPRFVEIAEVVRRSGIAEELWVVTNGRRLARMDDAFWRSLDGVEVSIYPSHAPTDEQKLRWALAANRSGTRLRLRPVTEFRESYSEIGATRPGLARAIYDSCRIVHEWRCHTLAEGRLYRCPQSFYLSRVLEPAREAAVLDSLALSDTREFGAKLRAFFNADQQPRACGHCLGTSGRRFAHAQVSRREFRAMQARPAEELVDLGLLRPSARETLSSPA